MITNIRIELSDDERERVGAAVYGKPTAVTRKQVNEIVDMLFEQLKHGGYDDVQPTKPSMGQPMPPAVPGPLPAGSRRAPLPDIGTFGKFGPKSDLYPGRGPTPAKPHDASYMRGWNQIGDAIAKGILK